MTHGQGIGGIFQCERSDKGCCGETGRSIRRGSFLNCAGADLYEGGSELAGQEENIKFFIGDGVDAYAGCMWKRIRGNREAGSGGEYEFRSAHPDPVGSGAVLTG